MNLNTIAELLGSPGADDATITGVCIDSRHIKPGNLFVALTGERFDGHDFIEEAANKGAMAIVCNRANANVEILQFVVGDSLAALAKIAICHRQTIRCPIIALTGSNGKTTVKEMIAEILLPPAHATPGNFNNHIGVPLALLQLKPEHRYAVFELGANHLGEIAHTVAMVKPDVALVNNIAPAHIGEFGSIAGIARAKGEIYQGLSANGTAIINADDNYCHFWDDLLANKNSLRFSLAKPADIMAQNLRFDEQGCANFTAVFPSESLEVSLQIPGEHAVRNALAAAACCYAVGLSPAHIKQGLNRFSGVAGRMSFLKGKNQSVIIDDTYNANLASALTAVNVLAKRRGYRILVLGDMGELGPWTKSHHEEVGRAASMQGIDLLLTCGMHSEQSAKAFGKEAKHYTDQGELAQNLLAKLDKSTTVLVKGSRSAAMEKIVQQLVG